MAVPAASGPDIGSSMLARAALILYSFNTSTPELSLMDVVRRTGLPRSSVHRILDQLVQLKGLERTGAKYRLGLRLIELGALAAHQNWLRDASLPYLHNLHSSTGALVHLSILDGHEIVYLEKIGGSPDNRIPSRLGGRQPAYCTSAGKAMLSFADEDELDEILKTGLPARTPFTITDPHAFRRELAQIRERGVAFDREENYRGIVCVAAPLRDATGRAIAAISLAGAPSRIKLQALIPPLLVTARQTRHALFVPGHRGPVPSAEPPRPDRAGQVWSGPRMR
ncbi:IclR family transcriptional regulator [Streptomyces sp. NPDC088147]|uniref:IclR family transcriptional regulator n=1 Tax=unclassified Streptomyces TaxID=2593676 RepID=UPI0033AD5CB6